MGSRLETLDRNPILKKTLEKQSSGESSDGIYDEDEEKKNNRNPNEEFVYYSYRKKTQMDLKKQKERVAENKKNADGEQKAPNAKKEKEPVWKRLAAKDNDVAEKSVIKVDDNLQIRFESG